MLNTIWFYIFGWFWEDDWGTLVWLALCITAFLVHDRREIVRNFPILMRMKRRVASLRHSNHI